MSLWWLCPGCLAAPVLAFGGWYLLEKFRDARELSKFRARAEGLLAAQPPPPVSSVLSPAPRTRAWHGGYVSFGSDELRARAQRLLRNGVVRRAHVLELSGGSTDGEWEGQFVYAFHNLDGKVEVHRVRDVVDARGAAVSQGSGVPAPSFDLHGQVGDWVHVLIDPVTREHLVYEALLVEEDSLEGPRQQPRGTLDRPR